MVTAKALARLAAREQSAGDGEREEFAGEARIEAAR